MAVQVIIMCKAPVAGQVKTRLMPDYSAEQAADIHTAMATTVIERAGRLFTDVVIAADDLSHPFFERFSVPIVKQGEGDLGARMYRLLKTAFQAGPDAILLLGTDSPHMPDSRLLKSVEKLHDRDVVIGPVEDGGYDLIALKRPWDLFEGVYWSGSLVLEQTLKKVRRLGLSSELLETAFDVDRPADLKRAVEAGWDYPG